MATGIAGIIEILQTLHSDIDGINLAPLYRDDYPMGDLNTADLPCVLVFPQEGIWQLKGSTDFIYNSRTYNVLVLVAKLQEGVRTEIMSRTDALIDKFGAVYMNSNNFLLQAPTTTKNEIALNIEEGYTDSGYLENIRYEEEMYAGFEYRISIREKGVVF